MVVCYSMLMKLLEIASTRTVIGPFTVPTYNYIEICQTSTGELHIRYNNNATTNLDSKNTYKIGYALSFFNSIISSS